MDARENNTHEWKKIVLEDDEEQVTNDILE